MYSDSVIFVNSLFNLILAIQLRITSLDENTDIILSDCTPQFNVIYEQGSLRMFFRNIYYADFKNFRTTRTKKLRFINMIFPWTALKDIIGNKPRKYNHIFFWNNDELFYNYYKYLKISNKKFKLHLYGDAVGAYLTDTPEVGILRQKWRNPLYNFLDKYIYRITSITNMEYDYFMFCPKLYSGVTNRKLKEIPIIDKQDREFISKLNQVFDYGESEKVPKVIYLDGCEYGRCDNRLLQEIKEKVGTDNFIVKPHPREKCDSYKSIGVKLLKISYPWEILCLNCNISSHIIITSMSSAAIMPSIIFKENPNIIIYMSSKKNIDYYETARLKLLNTMIKSGVKLSVVNNENELMERLSELLKGEK